MITITKLPATLRRGIRILGHEQQRHGFSVAGVRVSTPRLRIRVIEYDKVRVLVVGSPAQLMQERVATTRRRMDGASFGDHANHCGVLTDSTTTLVLTRDKVNSKLG